eukprot:GFYU01015081.1.p1 GENE.GFYU01015081.1~~GFYU01015081.1.p1  ORF type:complete len:502 (-),score=110.64 GFYU01015081.1:248-1699(-)
MWSMKRRSWQTDPSVIADSVRFYGFLVAIAVDVALGIFCSTVLYTHTEDVIIMITHVSQYLTSDGLREHILWFMRAPAGMKLNDNLGYCLGYIFLAGLDVWNLLISIIIPYLGDVIRLMVFGGCFGFSFLLCNIFDYFVLSTLHVYVFYIGMASLYKMLMGVLSSLFKLFRGKKWNVLKHRVDTCAYDLEQLLVGTVVFTLLLFLVPTIALYYFFFTFVRIVLVLAQLALSIILANVLHFPYMALGLYAIDSKPFSADIVFEVCKKKKYRPANMQGGPDSADESSNAAPVQSSQFSSLRDLMVLQRTTSSPVVTDADTSADTSHLLSDSLDDSAVQPSQYDDAPPKKSSLRRRRSGLEFATETSGDASASQSGSARKRPLIALPPSKYDLVREDSRTTKSPRAKVPCAYLKLKSRAMPWTALFVPHSYFMPEFGKQFSAVFGGITGGTVIKSAQTVQYPPSQRPAYSLRDFWFFMKVVASEEA